MKIAIYYPYNTLASWYTLGGYASVLRRMGHDVVDCPLPGNEPNNIPEIRKQVPTTEQLNSLDCIIVAFAEYVRPWLEQIYGLDAWRKIQTPKILRFDESFDREDLQPLLNWEKLKPWGDYYSFPAAQDAERFGGQWHTYGVDTEMFKPRSLVETFSELPLDDPRPYSLGFIGSMYPKRWQYAQRLIPLLGDIPFRHAPVVVQDLSGICEIMQTKLLVANYQRIKVFFVLPPMSQLLVMKVFEAMACGCCVMFPKLLGDAEKNMSVFTQNEHIFYYDEGYFVENVVNIRNLLNAGSGDRTRIATAGCAKIQKDHTLEQMFERILEPVAVTA